VEGVRRVLHRRAFPAWVLNPKIVFGSVLFFWVMVLSAGMRLLFSYEYSPSVDAKSPIAWPIGTVIRRNNRLATLVMLVHPRCSCSRASLSELARIMSRCQDKLTATVVFLKPEESESNWEKTDLWRAASRIPGVTVTADSNGMEAARFRAATSGQTLLYNREGKLLFSGGITLSRGHEGDNDGEDAILSLVATGTADKAETPVFGCSLLDSRPNPDEVKHP
jgi:hypothetical protein